MTAEMPVTLLGTTLRVNAESHATAADLLVIALTWHVALCLVDRSADSERVGAEALSSVFSTSHAETLAFAIGNTFGVGDLVVSNVCQLDASHDTVLGISKAALI
jgi:hypothetical protein